MTILLGFLVLLLISSSCYQVVGSVLLRRYLARKRSWPAAASAASTSEGISVLIPVKGVYPTFRENLRSILTQEYQGPFEVILGVQSESDPVLAVAHDVASALGLQDKMRYAVGGSDSGLNPKNSNLVRAFATARYDWIYCSDSDVSLEPGFFADAVSRLDENSYGTAFNIYHQAPNLGAALEAVGNNIEASAFFLFATLAPKNGLFNGASMFFHRRLLARVGGFEMTLHQVTDDLYLSGLFNRVGARYTLFPQNIHESIVPQEFAAFWQRFVRWLLILRCNRPAFFFAAPTGWVWIWCLVLGLITADSRIFALMTIALIGRLIFGLIFQASLAGLGEAWKVIVLPIYDFCVPFVWLRALFTRHIVWAGNRLIVSSNGTLIPTERGPS